MVGGSQIPVGQRFRMAALGSAAGDPHLREHRLDEQLALPVVETERVHAGPDPGRLHPHTLLLEASDVGARSPRSAAALLRLALQTLLRELSGQRDLNDAIAEMVSRGLSTRIQRAMEALRIIGNNAVHPGEIQIDDDPDMVESSFALLNVVVEDQIAQPAEIDELYEALPDRAREAVQCRDGDGDGTVTTS
jgi:hypothetical protein